MLGRIGTLCITLGLALAPMTAAAVELTVWEHEYEDIQKVLDGFFKEFEKKKYCSQIFDQYRKEKKNLKS